MLSPRFSCASHRKEDTIRLLSFFSAAGDLCGPAFAETMTNAQNSAALLSQLRNFATVGLRNARTAELNPSISLE
jgi:hypothetical protein